MRYHSSLSLTSPQDMPKPKFEFTVRDLIHKKIPNAYADPQFVSDVMKPLMDKNFEKLLGGEKQRIALALCLGKSADIYLIDEPSAFLDSEQRIIASKVIKRFILHIKKTAFVVEHDFIMATYLADKVIVYEGEPSVDCTASSPQSLRSGMTLILCRLWKLCFIPRCSVSFVFILVILTDL